MTNLKKGMEVKSPRGELCTVIAVLEDTVLFLMNEANVVGVYGEKELREKGFTWEGMDAKWKPELGERYYLPDLNAINLYYQSYWANDNIDRHRLSHGLIVRTQEEAVAKAQEILSLISK